ncbi:MAG: hypothetical protein M1327_03625 [Candidatus Thermoplasmatota archaeon]|nr:hypothetical protein [Candidatus Thermoplasmatota archaeon]
MKKLLVALHVPLDDVTEGHFSGRMVSAGFNVVYINAGPSQEDELDKIASESPGCLILTSGSVITAALVDSLKYRHVGTVIAINPLWNDSLKPLLSSVEASLIIFTDAPDLSNVRMHAMKYHDRIARSRIHYLRSNAIKTLLEHPDRIIKSLEETLDAK